MNGKIELYTALMDFRTNNVQCTGLFIGEQNGIRLEISFTSRATSWMMGGMKDGLFQRGQAVVGLSSPVQAVSEAPPLLPQPRRGGRPKKTQPVSSTTSQATAARGQEG